MLLWIVAANFRLIVYYRLACWAATNVEKVIFFRQNHGYIPEIAKEQLMPQQTVGHSFSYGKALAKTGFFTLASAGAGALCQLPSLSLESMVAGATTAGAAGLLVGAAVLGGCALMKHNPKADFNLLFGMVCASISINAYLLEHHTTPEAPASLT